MTFEEMLSGGHPNSLGRTVEAAEAVLHDPSRLEALLSCYRSSDSVVRLRTSSALKRVTWARPDLVAPYLDRLIAEAGTLDQASAQWTLAEIFATLAPTMPGAQRTKALRIMQRNLDTSSDWIVLIKTMETLAAWSREDAELAAWLSPRLRTLSDDARKSVRAKAIKLETSL